MTKTASARFSEEEVEDIEDYADRRGISTSKAIRELALAGHSVSGDTEASLDAEPELRRLQDLVDEANQLAAHVEQKTTAQSAQVKQKLEHNVDFGEVEDEYVEAFCDQPYRVVPKGENEYWVVVPRFVPFNAGKLHEQDDAWRTFIVNKYVKWIEDIPEPIQQHIDLEQRYDKAVVEGTTLELGDEEERDRAWDDLGGQDGGLFQRKGDTRIKIKRGSEFDIIAKLIEGGNLPFAPNPVDDDLLRPEPGVTLRSYQERAWETFVEAGHVGVYWPPSLGKTFFAIYAGDRIEGKTLVVVPSSTLESQWEERIEEFSDHPGEWEVRTYQYLTTNDNMQDYQGGDGPVLTVFDECHTLPANTFSKLSTLDTDYRIGLSATPYREDDRTDYIFALTGVPVGIEWEELRQHGHIEYPEVFVYLYNTERNKRLDLIDMIEEGGGKTLVFCDDLDAGERVARELDAPFVQGETPKRERMDIFRENRVVVGSRVADEGLSITDLDRVIEYRFHGASRRQELQRAGRVMHSEGLGQHIVQMTDAEFSKFSERLYSLEEKGMDVRLERRT